MVIALKVSPGEQPILSILVDDGDFLSRAITGDGLNPSGVGALRLEDGVAALYARDAMWTGDPRCRRINGRFIFGTIYIVGYKDGVLVSLTDHQAARYTALCWEEEYISEEEKLDQWMCSLDAELEL